MGVAIKVFGDYACFSRPEFKVERVSYLMVTPSAARGILEAVFWKPEFRYEIREIRILRFGAQTAFLRNEIGKRQGASPLVVEDERQQRTSLVLKNVAYEIHADILLRPHAQTEPGKYLDQFRRRVEKGQCHHTPCMGTREFAAYFEEADNAPVDPQLGKELDLGQMLFDIAYVEGPEKDEFFRPSSEGSRLVHGHADPLFFHAVIRNGVLKVPREEYAKLYEREAGHA